MPEVGVVDVVGVTGPEDEDGAVEAVGGAGGCDGEVLGALMVVPDSDSGSLDRRDLPSKKAPCSIASAWW